MTDTALSLESRTPATRISTGIKGLDDILCGGLTPQRVYLVEGQPGTGKTTLGLQYLLEGVAHGQSGLYITLSETEDELRAVAESHGWNLDDISILELANDSSLHPDAQQSVFHPSEVELAETTKNVMGYVNELKPLHIVFDSLSEMRLLAQNPLRYRRQILTLHCAFTG